MEIRFKSGRKQIDRSRIKSDNLRAIFISLNNSSIFDWINFNRIFPRWIIISSACEIFHAPFFFFFFYFKASIGLEYEFIKFNRI